MLTILLLVIILWLSFAAIILERFVNGKTIWVFSPVVGFTAYFLLRDFIGLVFITKQVDNYRALVAYIIAFCAIIMSTFMVAIIFKRRAHWGHIKEYGTVSVLKIYIIAGFLSLFITYVAFGRIPLFHLFYGLIDDNVAVSMQAARRMNTLTHHDGNTFYFGQGYFRVIYTIVAPFFLGVMTVRSILGVGYIKKRYKFAIFIFLIGALLGGQIWLAVKEAILFFYLFLFAISILGLLNINRLLKLGSLAYVFGLGFVLLGRYAQSISGRSLDHVVLDSLQRLFLHPQYLLFSLFPDSHAYRMGATWVNDLQGLLPGSTEAFAYEAHHLVYGGGWGYTLAPDFVTASYVNFGWVGVFGGVFLVTLLFSVCFRILIASDYLVIKCIGIMMSCQFAFNDDMAARFTTLILSLLIGLSYFFFRKFLRSGPSSLRAGRIYVNQRERIVVLRD